MDGPNTISVEAWDRCGVTLQTLELHGYAGEDPGSDVVNNAEDVTASLDADWSVTSWTPDRSELLADVAVRNLSDIPLPGPIHVAPGPELYPTISIVSANGQSPEGKVWVEVLPAGASLQPDAWTTPVTVRFADPQRLPVRFTPRFYAQSNRAPRFTTTPPLLADTRTTWLYTPALVDDDGDAVTLRLERGPDGMESDGTSLSWTPITSDIGVHDVVVAATDARGATSTQRFSLTVVEEIVNLAPVLTSAPITAIPRFSAYTYRATAVDADNDVLTWALVAAPGGAVVDPSGTVTWPSPTAGDSTFTLRVSDPSGAEAWQTWVLSVGAAAPTNAGVPQITSVPGALAVVGLPWQYQPVAFDSDGDPLLWSLANGPEGMQVDPTTGRVLWTPTVDDLGEQLISLIAIDGRGGVARQSWRLQVVATSPDLPPTILSVPSTVALVGVEYVYQARASDPELQPTTWSVLEGDGLIDPNGRFTWTPTAGGDSRFRIQVQDPAGNAGVQAFIVRARGQNSGPAIEAPPPQAVVAAGSDWMVDLDATDGDGDLITWSLVSGPDGVGVGATDGRVRWTPAAADQGVHSIFVQAADPFGLTDEVEILLQVVLDAIPPTPILVADRNPACTGDPVRICVGGVDNVGIERLELRVDGLIATPDGAGCITELRLDPVTVVFDLDAWDPSENTAHQVMFVDWRSCGGTPLGGP